MGMIWEAYGKRDPTIEGRFCGVIPGGLFPQKYLCLPNVCDFCVLLQQQQQQQRHKHNKHWSLKGQLKSCEGQQQHSNDLKKEKRKKQTAKTELVGGFQLIQIGSFPQIGRTIQKSLKPPASENLLASKQSELQVMTYEKDFSPSWKRPGMADKQIHICSHW